MHHFNGTPLEKPSSHLLAKSVAIGPKTFPGDRDVCSNQDKRTFRLSGKKDSGLGNTAGLSSLGHLQLFLGMYFLFYYSLHLKKIFHVFKYTSEYFQEMFIENSLKSILIQDDSLSHIRTDCIHFSVLLSS